MRRWQVMLVTALALPIIVVVFLAMLFGLIAGLTEAAAALGLPRWVGGAAYVVLLLGSLGLVIGRYIEIPEARP